MTVALVLAAGASSRLGFPKQLVKVDGEALVHRAARLALEAGCARVIVVEGAVPLADALAELKLELVRCVNWAEGMGASIRRGMEALRADDDAVLIMLVDQHLISANELRALLRAPGEVVAAEYGGVLGVPARFARSRFEVLRSLPPGEGARRWLAEHRASITAVSLPSAHVDLDRPDELPR